jgi:sterol desaturase/sphingolipid hydroxylase (fatty acid hydroxylase superfamily)
MEEPLLRIGVFALTLAALWAAEARYALLPAPAGRVRQGVVNLALGVLGAALVRLTPMLASVAVAEYAHVQGLGLFVLASLPAVLAIPLGIVALDLAIYCQHRLMHALPLLWRLHRMHHLETHLDATAGVRFHPVEILLSAVWRALVILAFGIPAVAVLAFEILVSVTSLFNHANLKIAPRAEAWVRRLLVTPAMHRVHHSIDPAEQRSNFCFTVPWWDWLFRSYRASAREVSDRARVGVAGSNTPAHSLTALLVDLVR